MWPLTSAFIEIALHRRGPQDLPASRFLMLVLLIVYFPVGTMVLFLRGSMDTFQFGYLIADTVLYLAFIFAVLRFFKRDRRFIQTVCALLGTDVFINAVSAPFALAGRISGVSEEESVLIWVYLVLFFWWIDVAGYILAKAIDQPYIVGLMFVILYVMTSLSIQDALTQAPI